ncbi:hypothetical protein [Deefgea sp. CFH1-16]|uniref:hypothetical protein n=1 Tax=Deefgea sp. CFH1-16 TaxID=2675457 RepID=UPI0015F3798B|nr:hypothetical protein [Deefgea sp. CFH1-16]MBM5573287.1 hypothetical protein [Deefgea sp. CFH1-16]
MSRFFTAFLLLIFSQAIAAPSDLGLTPTPTSASSTAFVSTSSEFERLNQRLELAQAALATLEKKHHCTRARIKSILAHARNLRLPPTSGRTQRLERA